MHYNKEFFSDFAKSLFINKVFVGLTDTQSHQLIITHLYGGNNLTIINKLDDMITKHFIRFDPTTIQLHQLKQSELPIIKRLTNQSTALTFKAAVTNIITSTKLDEHALEQHIHNYCLIFYQSMLRYYIHSADGIRKKNRKPGKHPTKHNTYYIFNEDKDGKTKITK